MVRSSLGVRLGRVSSGEPWVQGRLWEKKPKQCLSSLRTWISFSFILFLSVNNTHTNTHTHTHTYTKTSFLYHSQAFCLSFGNERHTHTHKKNSLVMFCFLSFVVFSPVVCFDVYYLFVCLLLFLFCESYMLLLHCRYKGYNANKIPKYRNTR